MKFKLVATLLAAIMMVAVMPGVASADKPLDLDDATCQGLLGAITAIDASGLVDYPNYGQLKKAVKDNVPVEVAPGVFVGLGDLLLVQLAPFGFTSTEQVVSTVGKCGITAQVVALVKD